MSIEQTLVEQSGFEQQGHSKLGIASLALSLITSLVYCLVIGVMFYMVFDMASTTQDPNQIMQEVQSGGQSGMMVSILLAGACMFISPVLSMVGLGLGIGGLFQKDKSKVFPVLGVIFSGLLLCGSGSFMLLGLVSALNGGSIQ